MMAEYIGRNTDIEVFGLTFKQMEQMADTANRYNHSSITSG
jgi:hypothetical protein